MKIALSGRACSGKSTIARILHEQHGFQVRSFAKPIRDAVVLSKRYIARGISTTEMGDFLIGLTDEETAMMMLREWFNIISMNMDVLLSGAKPRGFLQEWGSTLKTLDPTVFIRAAMEDAEDQCVIDDLRLADEAWELVDDNWILVKVYVSTEELNQRARRIYPESYHLLSHHTETELDDWDNWHYVIDNNGPKGCVGERVCDMMKALRHSM